MSLQVWTETYKVPDVPDGESGGWKIDTFSVSEDEAKLDRVMSGFRAVRPGTYKRLSRGKTVVMSDTPSELRDHLWLFQMMKEADSALIHGLGIGCAVNAAIMHGVKTIDVVELSPDVIELVGPHYLAKAASAGVDLTIHEGDALTYRFPVGRRWGIAWHDIWDFISEENLEGMKLLHRRYGRRVDWQGSWARELIGAFR